MKNRSMFIVCLCVVSLIVVTVCGCVWFKKHPGGGKYEIQVSGLAPKSYPTIIGSGLLWYSEKAALRVPPESPFSSRRWSAVPRESIFSRPDDFPMPKRMTLLWLSLSEYKCYYLATDLRSDMEELWRSNVDSAGRYLFTHIVVGMAPYGGVALWMSGSSKSILVDWMHGREAPEVADRFIPENSGMTFLEYCNSYSSAGIDRYWREHGLETVETPKNIMEWEQPPQGLYEEYMQQFRYRYVLRFEDWDEQGFVDSDGCVVHWGKPDADGWKSSFELRYFWEHLYDGTYDKMHDGRLFSYHTAGKPNKLRLEWHIGESDYMAYIWLDSGILSDVFGDFCGSDRDTGTDFMIRIDPVKYKFEISLHWEGAGEPVLIPEEAYQVIVFKDTYRVFYSENYAQPKNAWSW